MCGRYSLHASPEVVALQLGLDSAPPFKPSYNVCPGSDILVIRERRKPALLRWGAGGKLVNARAETLAERPAFRQAFRQYRCLVPASGFYEWQAVAGRKQPWYVRPKDSPLFALAGIILLWEGARSVAIITTRANELMADIHDRMPVIIPPESYEAWLGTQDGEAMLRPCPAERLQAHRVSLRVNTPANDDEALLQSI